MSFASVPDLILEPMVRGALLEDLGSYGDITTRTVVDADTTYTATINAREDAVVSGMQIAELAFRLVDPNLKVTIHTPDGTVIKPGDTLVTIEGLARSILSGERVALNFAGRLSGIATKTAGFVEKAKGTKAV